MFQTERSEYPSSIKLCLVSSSGGHLYKVHRLKGWWEKYDRFWITKDDIFVSSLLKKEKKYFAFFPENRNLFNFLRNIFLAWRILRKERPSLIFSTGAGVAPPFFLIAKLMGVKTVFMETFVFIPKLTLSGRLLSHFVDYFLVQNKKLLKMYPQAHYWGSSL